MDASNTPPTNPDEGLILPEPITSTAAAPAPATSNEPDNLPAPIAVSPQDDHHLTVTEHLLDIGKGALRGAEQTVRGIRQTAQGIAHATGLDTALGDEPPTPLEYKSSEPQTMLGKVTADVTSVALSYGTGSIALRGVKAGAGILGAMGKTAAGDVLTADPDKQRLSNLLEDYPWLKPAASFLSQNPEDPALVFKAKQAIEYVLVTGAAGVVFKGLHLAFLKATGKVSAEQVGALEKEVVAGANGTEQTANGSSR
jgi:hypothetical protein